MMNFDFSQIYPEIGASFSLSGMLLGLLIERLNSLKKEIQFFKNKYKGEDFSLVPIISATRNNDTLVVKGPRYLRKKNEVEFALHIPYKEIADFKEKVSYVLSYIAQGIIFVLEKYDTDSSGIEETIQDVVREVQNNPEAYQYAHRDKGAE